MLRRSLAAGSLAVIETGDLFLRSVDCRLQCCYCSHGIKKRARERSLLLRLNHKLGRWIRSALTTPEDLPRDFEREVGKMDARGKETVCVSGYDVLDYDGIFELLDVCRRHGRKIDIISPGLRLADEDFARRVAGYAPRVTLTYLTRRPDVYARMTGNPLAKDLVERALRNMRELKVDLHANFIATSENYSDLMDVASFLLDDIGLDGMTLHFFYPDKGHTEWDKTCLRLFVDYRTLGAELARFAGRYRGTKKFLTLAWVPPCKLDAELLASGRLRFVVKNWVDPTYPDYRDPGCDLCRWKPRCFFVSAHYRALHPDEGFPYQRVNQAIGSIFP